jgi:copper chaperone NosL
VKRRAFLLGLLVLAACSETDGPVEPVWGKQPCAHCAMILSDRRFGAQLVTAAGERLYFDDAGCMALAIEERGLGTAKAWVRDAAAAKWVDARTARFAAGAPTPMDFGFEAHAGGASTWDDVRRSAVSKARREP